MEGRFVKRKGRTNEKFRYNRQCYEEEGKSTGRVVVRGRKNKREGYLEERQTRTRLFCTMRVKPSGLRLNCPAYAKI